MILSASRRTDIPAFYSKWMLKRLEEGFVDVKFGKEIKRIELNKDNIDCIVFWTKNPEFLTDHLGKFQEKGIPFYFQFTLTSYPTQIEQNVPRKTIIISEFQRLSSLIGKERVIWRYDPILISPNIDLEYHIKYFDVLCTFLKGHTEKCIFSFLEPYKKLDNVLEQTGIRTLTDDERKYLLTYMVESANKRKIELQSCSQSMEKYGITRSKCIDDKLIERITGKSLKLEKDPYQRQLCGCVKSIDIGTYNTCVHECAYCYANHKKEKPKILNNLNKTSFS